MASLTFNACRQNLEQGANEKEDSLKTKRVLTESTSASQEQHRLVKRTRVSAKADTTISYAGSLGSLPPELFCHVLSFIGPTSSSLLSLSQLNHSFHGTMKAIGNAMLPRACAHFRAPLPRKTVLESSTSLFVRHARTCSRIINDLAELRNLLNRAQGSLTMNDVKTAMDLALSLLEISPSLSASLERQILTTCGKCGGSVFKYCKGRLVQALGEPVSDDVSPPTLRRRNEELSKNEERLDMSRLIMQIVVCREWQLSKELPTRLPRTLQKQVDLKCLATSGF